MTNVDELRHIVSTLPRKITCQYKREVPGVKNQVKWKTDKLSAAACREVILRQMSEERVLDEPLHRNNALGPKLQVAHAYWASVGADGELAARGVLPPVVAFGLWTAAKRGCLDVQLWTHHHRHDFGIYDFVTVRDAAELLPSPIFTGMLEAAWPLPNIADVVRCFACRATGGWMIDADTWWFAPPCGLESRTGHCFATQPAKNRVSGDKLYWQWKYCASPGVRSYIIPPLYFPPGSVVLKHAIADEAFGKFDDLFAFHLPPDDSNHS